MAKDKDPYSFPFGALAPKRKGKGKRPKARKGKRKPLGGGS
jgi:hypothetical protein